MARRLSLRAAALLFGVGVLPASGMAAVTGVTIPPPPLLQPPTFTPPPVASLGEVVVFAAGVDLNPVDGGERGGITIARADGTGLRKVTNFETRGYELSKIHGINFPDDHPSFSPDGTRIVFASNRADTSNGANRDIFVMRPNGTEIAPLFVAPGLDTEPTYSPDGTKIAFVTSTFGNLEVAVMNADGTGLVRLTNNPAEDFEPAWSRDGTQIAFTRATTPDDHDIWVMNADGSGQRRVTTEPRSDHDASWSLDGQTLLITSERPFRSPPFGNVYRVRVSDGAAVDAGDAVDRANGDLTDDQATSGGDPSLSPSGNKIAYFKSVFPVLRSPQELFTMNANGTGKLKIRAEGLVSVHPNWGRAADFDQNAVPDYLQTGNVGTSRLRSPRSVQSGRDVEVVLDWTHPSKPWQDLDRLAFTLRGPGSNTLAVIRFFENDRTFSLLDPRTDRFTPRYSLSGGRRNEKVSHHAGLLPRVATGKAPPTVVRAGAVSLDLRRTRVVDQSRRTVRLVLGLGFGAKAKGVYRIQAHGTSDPVGGAVGGDSQDIGIIGRLRIT
jgi:dipeptidyl aminopeptidase/acylaminoacyl peptidase